MVTTTISNIRCKCNQYPRVLVKVMSEGLMKDLGYMCMFMHHVQRPMTVAWLATIYCDILQEYRE